jgi:hypothetical protein
MSYLLFPGRHLVNTVFQEKYLKRVITEKPALLPGYLPGRAAFPNPPTNIVFAITSANQENSRYNPIPFHIRAIGVDRFARQLQNQFIFPYRIFGIPHYGHTENFAGFTIKEIGLQSEQAIELTPENCLVLCSTPEVIQLYQHLGFAIAPAEIAEQNHPPSPIEIVRRMGECRDWRADRLIASNLARSHSSLFEDFPEVPQRIQRLYQDPLTNQEGSLTSSRNYNAYARGMNEIIHLKYLDIKGGIKPGCIADEGCADGALLAEVSRDFPDSDLFGIDLSAEFAGRFHERQRAGEFGSAYVHFFHRNLFDRIFEPGSIDTTLCNSTLHEIWSYGDKEVSVRKFLAEKFQQLCRGGRLLIRDVVGPEQSDSLVFLWCTDHDGQNPFVQELRKHPGRESLWLKTLSTRSRFHLFANDFLGGQPPLLYGEEQQNGQPAFRLTLRQAAEFLSKKDYTDNWVSEMNEEFCFWSFPQWKQVLREIGFRIIENPNEPGRGSRTYSNPWIIEHRYGGHVRLADAKSEPLNWPPTNMIIFAEKPLN